MPQIDRLLFIAQPPAAVLHAMERVVEQNGLKARLGTRMFAAKNWHQSLSGRYPCDPITEQGLLRVGARVRATPFLLTLNRIRDQASDGPGHWKFKGKGRPRGFDALLTAIQTALSAEGFDIGPGHTPHVTISYIADGRLPSATMIPIHWAIDGFMLVRGGGVPYRYAQVREWKLKSPEPDLFTEQMGLC